MKLPYRRTYLYAENKNSISIIRNWVCYIPLPRVYSRAYTPTKQWNSLVLPFAIFAAAEQQQLTRVELHNNTTRGPQIRPFVPTWKKTQWQGGHLKAVTPRLAFQHLQLQILR